MAPPDVPLGPTDDPGPRILALAREVDRLRAEVPEVECPGCGVTIRARMSDAAGRAEAAQAVVRAWLDARAHGESGKWRWDETWPPIRAALDALARAHGEARAAADPEREGA